MGERGLAAGAGRREHRGSNRLFVARDDRQGKLTWKRVTGLQEGDLARPRLVA